MSSFSKFIGIILGMSLPSALYASSFPTKLICETDYSKGYKPSPIRYIKEIELSPNIPTTIRAYLVSNSFFAEYDSGSII